MKKTFITFCAVLLGITAIAQVTEKFNYQAVVRDNAGMIMPNQIVSVQLAILEGSANGQVQYIENHLISTNQFGLIKLEAGGGNVINGSWSNITWEYADHYLRVSIDVNGGNNFQFLGTSQLLSVPYAQLAEKARIDDVNDADSDPNNEIQDLELVNGILSISDGNSVVLPTGSNAPNTDNQTLTLTGNTVSISGGNSIDLSVLMNDSDSLNEIQNLSLTGNQLTISDGNTVTLIDNVDDADNDASNEIQDVQLSGNSLSLSNSVSNVDLSGYLDNTDNQTLIMDGNTLSISGGNSVFIPTSSSGGGGDDNQNIAITNDSLFIENGNGIDLSGYMDNTDNQVLQITGDFLTIQNGNTVLINDDVDDADSDPNNEIQNIYRQGNVLYMSDDPSTVDLSPFLDNKDEQTLSLSGNELGISNGNTITLVDNVDDADADATNEIQNLGINNNELSLSNSSNVIDLSPFLDNSDEQTLTLSGDQLSISNGNVITLVDNVDDADADATNEIQDLAINNYELSLSNSINTIDLSPFLDNTDEQSISLNGNTLSISGANSVDLSAFSSGQFSTSSNVVFNAGNHASDDFVFGAPSLNQNGNFNHYAKFFFDKSKFGAFRTGYVQGDLWDSANIGESSFASGYNSKASGDYSVSMGRASNAEGSNSISLGRQNNSIGFASTTIGFGSTANANYSFAGGNSAQAMAINSFAYGESVVAGGINSIAIGKAANAGTNGIALGNNASANQTSALALGTNTSSLLPGAIAIGENLNSEGSRSVSLGYNLKAPSYGETVIGYNNSNYASQSASSIFASDRLFTIGNGANASSLSDAFIVYKDGDAFLAGSVSTNSDVRLKKNIQPLNSSLEKILKLQGYTYQWNNKTPRDTEQINTGFIAQELELLFPELISTDGSGYKSVNYIAIVPHLVESIKEQAKQIESLSRKLSQQTEIHSELSVELNELMKRLQVVEQQLTLGKN